jgi:hypothetical protein
MQVRYTDTSDSPYSSVPQGPYLHDVAALLQKWRCSNTGALLPHPSALFPRFILCAVVMRFYEGLLKFVEGEVVTSAGFIRGILQGL